MPVRRKKRTRPEAGLECSSSEDEGLAAHDVAAASFVGKIRRSSHKVADLANATSEELLTVLQSYFGHTSFQHGQEVAIRRTLEGLSTLAIQPTGSGKSLCYQFPILLLNKIAPAAKHFILVVAPLLSLIDDQIAKLPSCLRAVKLTTQTFQILDRGDAQVGFVTPERLECNGELRRLLHSVAHRVPFVCVDEAHCVAEWGFNYRSSYLHLVDNLASCLNNNYHYQQSWYQNNNNNGEGGTNNGTPTITTTRTRGRSDFNSSNSVSSSCSFQRQGLVPLLALTATCTTQVATTVCNLLAIPTTADNKKNRNRTQQQKRAHNLVNTNEPQNKKETSPAAGGSSSSSSLSVSSIVVNDSDVAVSSSSSCSSSSSSCLSCHGGIVHSWEARHNLRLFAVLSDAFGLQKDHPTRTLTRLTEVTRLLQRKPFNKLKSIIVYCYTQAECERLTEWIRHSVTSSCSSFHAGQDASHRRKVHEQFASNKLRIIVATIAFGMGINKADVDGVVHYNLPTSLEGYMQQVGRGGRGGGTAHCCVFVDNWDFFRLRSLTYNYELTKGTVQTLCKTIFKSLTDGQQEKLIQKIRAAPTRNIYSLLRKRSTCRKLCVDENVLDTLLNILCRHYPQFLQRRPDIYHSYEIQLNNQHQTTSSTPVSVTTTTTSSTTATPRPPTGTRGGSSSSGGGTTTGGSGSSSSGCWSLSANTQQLNTNNTQHAKKRRNNGHGGLPVTIANVENVAQQQTHHGQPPPNGMMDRVELLCGSSPLPDAVLKSITKLHTQAVQHGALTYRGMVSVEMETLCEEVNKLLSSSDRGGTNNSGGAASGGVDLFSVYNCVDILCEEGVLTCRHRDLSYCFELKYPFPTTTIQNEIIQALETEHATLGEDRRKQLVVCYNALFGHATQFEELMAEHQQQQEEERQGGVVEDAVSSLAQQGEAGYTIDFESSQSLQFQQRLHQELDQYFTLAFDDDDDDEAHGAQAQTMSAFYLEQGNPPPLQTGEGVVNDINHFMQRKGGYFTDPVQVAKVAHGIATPCHTALDWGDEPLWGRYIDVDFALLAACAAPGLELHQGEG
eukprot:TRINITY_DN66218_c4_g1_i1.p1 TRINITY_DN66218_c4_g1~~TRINITY_DN66218_c4_g1_i1.p1  ORF type:complete len:1065 (+),score=162.64 TRINITY_DN66218_c4_g1_i1:52-3246(+)